MYLYQRCYIYSTQAGDVQVSAQKKQKKVKNTNYINVTIYKMSRTHV